jgi:pimeloyl-ACP methyl ester carboxylesterase
MHRQAYAVLPLFLDALGLNPAQQRISLFGHSDGASIALLYATKFPACVQSVIVLAPHIMVEDMTIDSIALARTSYQQTDLPKRLARYHDAPESAFWAWCTIWLNPAFREWSITSELDTLSCPVLAVQGLQDEYGTLAQIHGIAQRVPQTTLLELSDCGHSPHRDQAERLIATACTFIQHNNGDKT